MKWPWALFFCLLLPLIVVHNANAAKVCAPGWGPSNPPPSQYSAPWDPTQSTNPGLVTIDCNQPASSLLITFGGFTGNYVLDTAYISTDGTGWQPLPLSGGTKIMGRWFPISATASVSLSVDQFINHWTYLAFLVSVSTPKGVYLGGCYTNVKCTVKWSVQAFAQVDGGILQAPSGTPSGIYSDVVITVTPNDPTIAPACFNPTFNSSGTPGPVTLLPVPC